MAARGVAAQMWSVSHMCRCMEKYKDGGGEISIGLLVMRWVTGVRSDSGMMYERRATFVGLLCISKYKEASMADRIRLSNDIP